MTATPFFGARAPRPSPLLVPAVALMLGIWGSEALGVVGGALRSAAVVVPFLAFVLLLVVGRRASSALTVGLVAVIALAAGFARHQAAIDLPAQHIVHALGDEPVLTRVAGRIVLTPVERPAVKLNPFLAFEPPARTNFVLALEELRTSEPPTPIVGDVRVTIEATGLNLRLGERVQLAGKVFRMRGPRNPGELNWAQWYRRQGIYAGMSVEGAAYVEKLPGPISLWHRLIAALRAKARGLLFEPFADLDADESVRLLDVMVLGQRSTADQQLNEAFLRAGGLHFLAVSGFNVAVLAGAAWWVVRRALRQSDKAAAVATLVLTLLFTLVTEPNAPVLRGATGVGLAALAYATGRPLCAINWLALAAGCVLLWNPNELFRAGFQLSFVQVLGLILVVPSIYHALVVRHPADGLPREAQTLWQLILVKTGRGIVGLVVVCICAWLTAVPLVLFHFGRLAPWGWLGTVPLTPLVTFVTVLSLATLAANAVLPPLGALLGLVLQRATELLLWSVGLFHDLPAAVVECRSPPVWLVMATYGLVLAGFMWQSRRHRSMDRPVKPRPSTRRAPILPIAGAGLLVLGWAAWLGLPARGGDDAYELDVLAVGNGAASALILPRGRAIVFDVGTDTNSDAGEALAQALRTRGVAEIEAVFISHPNFDHYSGLPTLAQRWAIPCWFVSAYFPPRVSRNPAVLPLYARLPEGLEPAHMLRAGEQLQVDEARLEVLWPPDGLGETRKMNDRSLVIRLSVGGRTVLFTGDVERDALAGLLSREREGEVNLRADVLVAPHHGQVIKDVTADFYAAVSPRIVVVSTRTPRPKLGQLVADALGPGCQVLETGQVGAVVVRMGFDGQMTVETAYSFQRKP